MSNAIVTFDYAQFIALFPAFSNPVVYPEVTLEQYWQTATYYVSDIAFCGSLRGEKRQYAIYLMMAHLIYLADLIATGQVPTLVQGSSIDKISVTLTPPKLPNQFSWWLNTTPYGMQLYALLQVYSVGGFYIGGSPVLGSFRWGLSGRGGNCC